MRTLLANIIISLLVFAPRLAYADECDAITGQMIASVTGVRLEKRQPVEGATDIVYLNHVDASLIAIYCPQAGVPWPVLNVDWAKSLPPPAYFNLVGRLGSVMTGLSAKAITKGARKCQKLALASNDELGDLEVGGITYECQAFTRDGGATAMTIAKHTSEK